MYKYLNILLITLLMSCYTTQEERAKAIYLKNRNEQELNDIVSHAQAPMNYFIYNCYISGELNNIKVDIDLYSSSISSNQQSWLLPVRIMNKSNRDLSLNSSNDKIYVIFDTQQGYAQLQLLKFPKKIKSDSSSIFIAKYDFINDAQRAGYEATLILLRMFIDSINSGKSIPSKSEISNMEKQMKFVFIGKFEMEKNSLMMPLNYKIVKSK
ncbi:MAG: hypothetical protein KA369_23715 [Spirochaetes bacterium]|nr:hypothetical protein [Spirochaetota bacterium]